MLTLEEYKSILEAIQNDPRCFLHLSIRQDYDDAWLQQSYLNIQAAYNLAGDQVFHMELGQVAEVGNDLLIRIVPPVPVEVAAPVPPSRKRK